MNYDNKNYKQSKKIKTTNRVYALSDSFLLFGARDKLIDYLLYKNDKRRELATTWLTLLGWRSIYFGRFDDIDQKIIENQTYSADTIAEYSKNILLVIDRFYYKFSQRSSNRQHIQYGTSCRREINENGYSNYSIIRGLYYS